MKTNTYLLLLTAATVMAVPSVLCAQSPTGTAFTYQGRLKKQGAPVNGTADFQE